MCSGRKVGEKKVDRGTSRQKLYDTNSHYIRLTRIWAFTGVHGPPEIGTLVCELKTHTHCVWLK